MALDNFTKVGLTVVIILLVGILGTLSGCVTEPVPTTTTSIVVTTRPTTTTPIITTSSSTSTSTTTQPLAEYGSDLGNIVLKSSKSKIHAGNFVDLGLSFYNVKRRTLNITQVELYGVNIQKGSASDNIWGLPEGDIIITPYKFLYPRESLEYSWMVQAPTGVVNETKFFFKGRIYYWGDSTKYYVDAPELRITVNP